MRIDAASKSDIKIGTGAGGFVKSERQGIGTQFMNSTFWVDDC